MYIHTYICVCLCVCVCVCVCKEREKIFLSRDDMQNIGLATKFMPVFPCAQMCSGVSDSLLPRELQPARLLCPWESPGKSPGVGCHTLLQGIFSSQGSNPGLPHCRQLLYP